MRHVEVVYLYSWKGREVERIKQETGEAIKIPTRREKLESHEVVMMGSREALGRAEAMVQDTCRNTVELPKESFFDLSFIMKTSEATGAILNFRAGCGRVVSIADTEEEVSKAKLLVERA